MNADDLKELTTESLRQLAALLEQGQSERLAALWKTMLPRALESSWRSSGTHLEPRPDGQWPATPLGQPTPPCTPP
jgi:hypothetical protein